MLNATVQNLRAATILHLRGQIVIGNECSILQEAAIAQAHAETMVIDLAHVDRVDAGGLGVLVGLREWARSRGVRLKLMNAINGVAQVLELTRLDHVFEFYSAHDLICLLNDSIEASRAPNGAESAGATFQFPLGELSKSMPLLAPEYGD